MNTGFIDIIENRFKVKDKGLKVVTEELKQRVVAKSAKLTRHEARTEQYIQNRMFQTNQGKLFERLEKENRSNDIRTGSQEGLRYCSGIWNQSVKHNNKTQWLKKGKDTFKRSKEVRKHHYNHWQFEKKPSYEE